MVTILDSTIEQSVDTARGAATRVRDILKQVRTLVEASMHIEQQDDWATYKTGKSVLRDIEGLQPAARKACTEVSNHCSRLARLPQDEMVAFALRTVKDAHEQAIADLEVTAQLIAQVERNWSDRIAKLVSSEITTSAQAAAAPTGGFSSVPVNAAEKRLHTFFRRFEGRCLADELIAERREEARRSLS